MAGTMERYHAEPGSQVGLSQWDPNDKILFDGAKQEGKKALGELNDRLEVL